MAKKTCPRCGAIFNCEGEKDCWCEQKQIHRAEMIKIMERYTDCICPSCLKTYEARE